MNLQFDPVNTFGLQRYFKVSLLGKSKKILIPYDHCIMRGGYLFKDEQAASDSCSLNRLRKLSSE